jgi:uroporphyrinogen III methyltransferase / synthase
MPEAAKLWQSTLQQVNFIKGFINKLLRMSSVGKVYIAGAGPGDEKLITLRAIECLKKAEVVIYDYLVNISLLNYCPENCLKIYAGKKSHHHVVEQNVINDLILSFAQAGKTVVRLKGGDPFVFGRGGEEAHALAEENIPFEIIPGVTAGIAAAAYAGIPVTHRDCGSTLALITGHESAKKEGENLDYEVLSRLKGTLVFYMGVTNLPNIATNLMRYGRSPQTPVALVRWGTTSRQQTLTGTLSDIAQKVKTIGFKPPALVVVGDVVNFRDTLQWFENKPLFGKRILVTRSRQQISVLTNQLTSLGADIVELPTIDIRESEDKLLLDNAIKKLTAYQWIIFSSTNAVRFFFKRLNYLKMDARALSLCKLAVVGDETAEELSRFGLQPDLLPDNYSADGIIDAFNKLGNLLNYRILLPVSEIAHKKLPEALRKMGAEPVCIPVYTNVLPDYDGEYLQQIFAEPFDLITFTSSSTASNFVQLIDRYQLPKEIKITPAASIGPATTKAAITNGLNVVISSEVHSIKGLVDSVNQYFIK